MSTVGQDKRIDAKDFINTLKNCKSGEEIFDLLLKDLGKETVRERLQHVSDIDEVVALEARLAEHNTGNGCRLFRQDCVNMAAKKYKEVEGKNTKYFKAALNRHLTRNGNTAQNENTVQKDKQKKAKEISMTPIEMATVMKNKVYSA